jgi:glycerol kinase
MSKKAILAIDQGTTGTTAVLVDTDLNFLAKSNREFPQVFPKPGWVEHNLDDIWKSVEDSVGDVLSESGLDPNSIECIGITNQRETVGVWERESGKALRNAIVWQCRRTSDLCNQLKRDGLEVEVRNRAGLLLDPYFSGSKIRWMLEEDSEVSNQVSEGKAIFGNMDTYVAYRLSGNTSHVTEPSNASRMMLMNLETQEWDDVLLDMFKVPKNSLPEIKSSNSEFGKTRGLSFLPDGIPIYGILGDQQSALFGQACFDSGQAKVTFGTGSFLLINTGSEIKKSQNRLLTTVSWKMGSDCYFSLEGSAFIAGAAVQWLRDKLQIVKSAPEIEELAKQAKDEDMGDLVVVPAFAGLGAPHWRSEARGVISGITRGTGRCHIARATLEAIALQNMDLLTAMEKDGQTLSELRVDGGASVNDFLIQIQADLIGRDCVRPKIIETTAMGAAMMAGLGAGVWSDLDSLKKSWKEDKRFSPIESNQDYYESVKQKWEAAVLKA